MSSAEINWLEVSPGSRSLPPARAVRERSRAATACARPCRSRPRRIVASPAPREVSVNGARMDRGPVRGICIFVALLVTAAACGIRLAACGAGGQTDAANSGSDLLGKTFPNATGENLAKKDVTVPGDFAGAPLIVLVAPSKSSQPDADKWIGALRMTDGVEFVETPVLPSLLTGLMKGFVNGKMRGGEPKALW